MHIRSGRSGRRTPAGRPAIHDYGLPAPRAQFWVEIGGIPTYRLDLAYPHARGGRRVDGEEFHTSEAQKGRDRERRAWLRDHGWHVIVVTKHSFSADATDAWLRKLHEVLRDRGINLR